MRTLLSYAVALLAGLLLLALPSRAWAGDVPGLAWTAPARVRVTSWPADPAGAAITIKGDRPVEVRANQVLLLDARAGDIVEVTGAAHPEDLDLGLVLEARGRPASITWVESTPRPTGRELTVPIGSGATAVAARPHLAARLTALVAETEVPMMPWERFEDDAVAWLEGSRPAPPSPPAPTMDASLRRVEAMRAALGPAALTPAGRAWLSLVLVEAGFLHRPLIALTYPTAWMKLGGEVPTDAEKALYAGLSTPVQWPGTVTWRRVAGGSDLPIEAAGGDALQLTLFAAGESPARVTVRAGGLPVRAFALPGRHEAPVTPNHGRVLLPIAQRAVSLHVEGGSILAGVTATWNRVGIGDTFTRRRDRAHLAAVAGGPSAGPLLRALAEAWREPGRAALQRLVEAGAGDLAPGPRAVRLWETAKLAPSTPAAVDAVVAGWEATAALAPGVALPLRRALVEALLDRRLAVDEDAEPGDPFAGLRRLMPPVPRDPDDDDTAAIRAALAALDPPRDGRRPALADEASRYALRHGLLADAKARARRVWSAESAWRALVPEEPAEAVLRWITPPYREGLPPGVCSPVGPEGHRWTRLAGGVEHLDVRAPAGATHVVGTVRAEARARLAGEAFAVDGVAVPVHAEIGIPSRVALAAGEHRLSLAAGAPPVLALFPRADPLPCASLRDLERWYRADHDLTLRLPAGEAETVLRVALRPLPEGPAAERVTVEAGGVRAETSLVAGEEATVELPWRRDGTAVPIHVSTPVWLRVTARLRRLPASAAVRGTGVVDEAAAIARIRAIAHGLRAVQRDAERAALLRERAGLLQQLGFARLAASDRVLAGEALPADEDSDDADPPRPATLPPGAGPVVPWNVAARVPVLAPAAPAISDRDAARTEGGDFAAVVAALVVSPRAPHPTEATLLLALAAAGAQRWEVADAAYERLALEAGSPAAAVEAAGALAEMALARRDPDLVLRGYLFARRGELAGADARAVRGRLDPAVRFERAADADALGYAWVERRGGDAQAAASLASRVRRALLDAPAHAVVLTEGERAVAALHSSRRVIVEASCVPVLAPDELFAPACHTLVEVDGSPRACAGASGCTLDLTPGPHRLEVELLAPGELAGWVRLRDGGSAKVLPLSSAARWFEIDGAHPLALAFAGPTLVRVAGRGDARGGGRVAVIVDGARAGELDLAQPTDADALRRDVKDPALRALGEPRLAEIVVLEPGPHTLRIVADRRTLVLPSVAGPHGLPRPRAVAPRQAPAAQAGLPLAAWTRAPEVGDDPWPGPLTLSTHAHAVMGYLGDPAVSRNVSADYLELDVQVRRRLFGDLAYVRAGALVRPRTTASTFGLAGRVDVNGPLGIIPRAYVQGELYAQRLEEYGVGAQLHSGLWWQIMPTSIFAFVPTIGLDMLHAVPPTADPSRVEDPDVYLKPGTFYPRLVFISLLTSLRPTMDTYLRVRTGVHLDDFASVVDAYVTPSFEISPGRGLWPELSIGYTGTRTFEGLSPPGAYTSHMLTLQGFFWHWLVKGHRLTVDATAQITLAGPPQSQVVFGVGYDSTWRRGVEDFGPLEMDFRERFDEDGGRVVRRQRGETEIPAEPVSP